VVLSLEAPGFEPRQVTIDGMVLYSEVNRVMSLLSKGVSAKGEVLLDSDHDGVPDVYDADPTDPMVTFVNKIPPEGYLSVAFEDLYLQASAGDADYNDFLAKYRVAEYSATSETLSSMVIEAVAVAKLAGYNHDFGMVIDFDGVADLHIEYFDAGGSLLKVRNLEGLQDKAVIPLFESTRDSIRRSTKAVLTFQEPVRRDSISLPPYDPYLYVWNTKYDIHLIGRESLPKGIYPVQNNPPGATFQDLKGFPWTLLVPIEWKHPAETQYIGKAYPLFDRWRESFGKEVPSWYLYPADIRSDPNNHPPYPVISDQGQEPTIVIGPAADYQLKIDIPSTDNKPDPDGDPVSFLSSQLPSCMQLDSTSGKVTISPNTSAGQHVVYFWSVDDQGASTIDKAYRVQFTLVPMTTNHPPSVVFAVPPITGSTALGGTLTAAYSYSDPDGDAEGATTYQWYRFSTSAAVTEGMAIAGATGKSYTTVDLAGNSDSGQWLRVLVTPVDARGAAGTPVLSGPVQVNRRVVIDTFMPTGFFQNDTFLTLVDAAGSVIAQDDNGNPDQKNHQYCSRIDRQSGLPTGTYYVKVHKPTDVGSQLYCIRVLDYNPGAVFPATAPVFEANDGDDAVGVDGLPLNPVAIALGQVISRMIEPELTDNDWFTFTLP
jgi:LruC domain-containing protein